jgi:type I restriction enzyme M protein
VLSGFVADASNNDNDLKEFVALQATFANSEQSWSVDVKGIDQTSFDLSVKNPNKDAEDALRDPQEIIAEIMALDVECAGILEGIRGCCERVVANEGAC